MPFTPHRVSDALTGYQKHQQYPHAGQWEFGGSLFCFGVFSDEFTPFGIALYKSTDRGVTWARANQTGQIPITVGVTAFTWGTCTSINYSMVPEVFLACTDSTPDGIVFLSVYRWNLSDEAVTANVSHAGLDLFTSIPVAYWEDCCCFVEQSTVGTLGVMSITAWRGPMIDPDYTLRRACLFQIDQDLIAFSSPPVVIAPADISKHSIPVGIARGSEGRVHGIIKIYGSGRDELHHTLVINTTGNVGTGLLDFISYTGGSNHLTSDAVALGLQAVNLLVFVFPSEGFHSLTALSADVPKWTAQIPFSAIGGMAWQEGFAFFEVAPPYSAWMVVLTEGLNLYMAIMVDGQWETPVKFFGTGAQIHVISGASTPTIGLGVFLTPTGAPVFPFPPYSELDLWFVSLGGIGCGPIVLLEQPVSCALFDQHPDANCVDITRLFAF